MVAWIFVENQKKSWIYPGLRFSWAHNSGRMTRRIAGRGVDDEVVRFMSWLETEFCNHWLQMIILKSTNLNSNHVFLYHFPVVAFLVFKDFMRPFFYIQKYMFKVDEASVPKCLSKYCFQWNLKHLFILWKETENRMGKYLTFQGTVYIFKGMSRRIHGTELELNNL